MRVGRAKPWVGRRLSRAKPWVGGRLSRAKPWVGGRLSRGTPPVGELVEPAERVDLAVWAAASLAGLALTWAAVEAGAALGTASAPFLGSYRFAIGFGSVLAPALAVAVLLAGVRGVFTRVSWRGLLALGWLGSAAWALSLALVDGSAGLTRSLDSRDNYLVDLPGVGGSPLAYLDGYTDQPALLSIAARGHPPGQVLLLWGLHRLGVSEPVTLGLLVTAVGALLTPLVLAAVRGVCGEPAARAYAPVLMLAPYAVWVAVSVDVAVAVLGALAVLFGVWASDRSRAGLRAAGWALACGVAIGTAALFSYAAPWLGVSAICLYFARRRPFLNLATGLGALLPVFAAWAAGFNWFEGLLMARNDYITRIEPERSAVTWSFISVVVLLLAAGPALVRSVRRLRNTPGWPFLVGAGAAVAFSILFGLARGGAEEAWLPFFPWLTVAAVAPTRQAGDPVPTPFALVAGGALTAVVIEAVLLTSW